MTGAGGPRVGALMGSRRGWRAAPAGVAGILLVVAALAPTLPAAADDLDAAQRRANRAADDLARATEEMARADDMVAHLQIRVARVDARVAEVRDQVRQLAVRQYVQGTARVTRLLRMADANQLVRAQQFASVVAETSTEALEQYRADKEDLRREVAALEREQRARATTVEELRRRRATAVRELERLARVEAEARAAREAEARRVEAEARRAEAAPTPSPTADAAPSSASPTSQPAEAGRPARPATLTPAPASTATTRAPAPAQARTPDVGGDWICPVQGPRAFSNDYGAARGGGSGHMGNDILAPKGTPVVANVSGVVTQRTAPSAGWPTSSPAMTGTGTSGPTSTPSRPAGGWRRAR